MAKNMRAQLVASGFAALFALLLSSHEAARADVLLPCPPAPDPHHCLDCGPIPGMPPNEHPAFAPPCWANGPVPPTCPAPKPNPRYPLRVKEENHAPLD
jgi:hypothetical protein